MAREPGQLRFDRDSVFKMVRRLHYRATLDGVEVEIRGQYIGPGKRTQWFLTTGGKRFNYPYESKQEAMQDAVLFAILGEL